MELAPDYYTNVGLMSVGLEQQKYFEYFNPKNPLSPLNVFGPYAKVKVRIQSTPSSSPTSRWSGTPRKWNAAPTSRKSLTGLPPSPSVTRVPHVREGPWRQSVGFPGDGVPQ